MNRFSVRNFYFYLKVNIESQLLTTVGYHRFNTCLDSSKPNDLFHESAGSCYIPNEPVHT